MRGPIDFIVVGFKGPRFDGSVLEALGDALDREVIGLVALSVIHKDAEGNVSALNVAESEDRLILDFVKRHPPDAEEIDDDDIKETAELLENDTAAALLMIEHLWAIPLKQALVDAGGQLVAEGRIHPDAEEELGADAASKEED